MCLGLSRVYVRGVFVEIYDTTPRISNLFFQKIIRVFYFPFFFLVYFDTFFNFFLEDTFFTYLDQNKVV